MAYTEDTARQRIVEIINEIIKEENLPFDRADVQIQIEGRRYPDIVLWKKKRVEGALLIELKQPFYDPWDVADEAHVKAWMANIRFFATWNLRKFFCWDRLKPGDRYDQLIIHEDVVDIKDIRELDRAEASIRKFLRKFLREFSEIYTGRKPAPLMPLDERFIVRLRSAIDAFSIPVFDAIKQRYIENKEFQKELMKWFKDQGYIFSGTDEDFEKVARQYVYLLVDKIIFYNVLRTKYTWWPKIQIPPEVEKGEELKNALQEFFEKALDIDYETIFSTDFLDTIPPPDDLVEPLKHFINEINRYDFSKIGYDIIGRVFERLIPDVERHKLGQYYTRSDVVDLIIGFCIRRADDKVFDPACGAGTFLVRAYARKKYLDPSRDHETLLKELWGNDIAKFPAHLATINLASRDLSVERNYPIILNRDFFDLKPHGEVTILPLPYKVRGLDRREFQVKIPYFDAVVTNPPYTRQEEMEDIVYSENYKKKLQKLVKSEWDFHIGKRASIYAYFFIHGAKFLKEGGRLGLITSNSWLDVDYGKYLQEFFLKNFKIIAIIESKVERWFEDADVNTAITILERCSHKEERDNNLVKFVQLKKPLAEFIPVTKNEEERWKAVADLVDFIEKTNEYYEDDKIRILPKKQIELWEEGFDEDAQRYIGSKWGRYLRAPSIFFKVLEKGKNILVPLKRLAKVEPGIKTGADKFFYLKEDDIRRWGIEKEYLTHGDGLPNLVIRSIREIRSISIRPEYLKYRVLMVHEDKSKLKGKKVLNYIEYGESLGLNDPKTHPTCGKRERWYDLGEQDIPPIVWPDVIYERYLAPLNEANAYADYDLHEIKPYDPNHIKIICALLNSTLTILFAELLGRVNLGEGALKMQRHEIADLLIPHPQKLRHEVRKKLEEVLDKIKERQIESIFEELGANNPKETSLDKVKPDRRELDKIVMGEILGLSEEEQLEVYRAVIDLVRSRIERARSVGEKKRKVKGIDVDALAESVLREIGRLKRFPDDFIGHYKYRELVVPRGRAEVGSDLLGFYVRVGGQEIRCKSRLEAKFIKYAVMNGHTIIRIPVDEKILEEAVKKYEQVLREIEKKVDDLLDATIPEGKLKKRIKNMVWERLWKTWSS